MAKAIEITRGDDEDLELEVTDEATGQPVSLADSVVFITIKSKVTDTDEAAKLTHDTQVADTVDTQAGKVVIRLPNAKTSLLPLGQQFIDVQVKFGDGSIKTVYNNAVMVIPDITRRIEAI